MSDVTYRSLARNIMSFFIGAPFVTAFVWYGAYLFWSMDPTAMAPAGPPWFHDPLRFLSMAIFGCFVEVLMIFVLGIAGLGAYHLGRQIERAVRRWVDG